MNDGTTPETRPHFYEVDIAIRGEGNPLGREALACQVARKLERERDQARAELAELRTLCSRSVKWIERMVDRKGSLPDSMFDGCDPAPLAKNLRQAIDTAKENA